MSTQQFTIACDFTETTLLDAANALRVPAHELTIWVSANQRYEARKAQGQYGFALVLVPPEILLTNGFAWCAQSPCGNLIWSPGV